MKLIEKYTFGVGDRFAHQASAQLTAFQMLAERGVEVTPVWNKSNREHTFVGSQPSSVFSAAEKAVQAAGWNKPWHVDADHIGLKTVEPFIDCSDFFTIDVADWIGKPADATTLDEFVERHPELQGQVDVPGLSEPIGLSADELRQIAEKYLLACQQSAEVYKHIAARKGADKMITEVSMDETDLPQTPKQLLVILAALADAQVPLQTIAPKFTGRFNKGVDYVGDLAQFRREFYDDISVLAFASRQYGLPTTLKLSVHSGSDKFSLYPIIRQALKDTGAGVHVKTAGTTWLEEIIGLAEAGGAALQLTKELYAYAVDHVDELCAPYASVIDIDRSKLPSLAAISGWSGAQFASAIRHVPTHPDFNANMRQLLHVSFKLAAKRGEEYYSLLKTHREIVAKQVTENLFERHLRPLFA
jgi:hypothetical protein